MGSDEEASSKLAHWPNYRAWGFACSSSEKAYQRNPAPRERRGFLRGVWGFDGQFLVGSQFGVSWGRLPACLSITLQAGSLPTKLKTLPVSRSGACSETPGEEIAIARESLFSVGPVAFAELNSKVVPNRCVHEPQDTTHLIDYS